MKTLLTLAILPVLLTNCMVAEYQDRHGNGVAITEARPLAAFSRVDMEGSMHVTIQSGPEYAAYVTSDANLSCYIQTNTFGGVLTIGLNAEIEPVVVPEITVVVPNIHSVSHNGNGLVDIQEGGDFPDLSFELNGGGQIRFSGTAAHLKATLNGSGIINLQGFAALLTADLSGSGEIQAENLLVEDADVYMSGSGNVYLDLDYESTLNVNLTGSGQVEWWGAPQSLNYTLTGFGKVIEHRGLPKKSALVKKSAVPGKPYAPVNDTTKSALIGK
jgi:hypothetical protein